MFCKRYSDEDYTNAYLSLNQKQRDVLDNYVKIGYQTKWLYILANKKGLLLTEKELEEKNIEELRRIYNALDWALIDYTDYFKRNNNVRCECGKALRYAYKVKYNPTGKIYTLGTNHFEQYTNISPSDVKDILNNFKSIDLEKMEILGKVIENRDIDIMIKINKDYLIPADMIRQIEVKLPLLDRQLRRLKDSGAFSNYENKIKSEELKKYIKKDIEKQNYEKTIKKNTEKQCDNNYVSDVKISKPNFEIDIQEMINKFESKNCTVEEAKKYLEYFKYYKNTLYKLSLDKNKIKKALYRILGNLPTGELRTVLVEIGFIICPDF